MKCVIEFGPETVHVEMEGSFTFADSHTFHRMLQSIISEETCTRIMINVSRLKTIDSTGIRLMMLVNDVVKKAHSSLVIKGPQGQVLLRLTEAAQYNALTIAA